MIAPNGTSIDIGGVGSVNYTSQPTMNSTGSIADHFCNGRFPDAILGHSLRPDSVGTWKAYLYVDFWYGSKGYEFEGGHVCISAPYSCASHLRIRFRAS
jgi:hypothetical protein